MFITITKSTQEPDPLDLAIHRQHHQLLNTDIGTSEYSDLLDQLDKLYEMKNASRSEAISPNQVIAAITSLAGILLVLNFEDLHVITSKAFGLVSKMKI